jgi:hypothetical protein
MKNSEFLAEGLSIYPQTSAMLTLSKLGELLIARQRTRHAAIVSSIFRSATILSPAVEQLGHAGLAKPKQDSWARVIAKPFGSDLKARAR